MEARERGAGSAGQEGAEGEVVVGLRQKLQEAGVLEAFMQVGAGAAAALQRGWRGRGRRATPLGAGRSVGLRCSSHCEYGEREKQTCSGRSKDAGGGC